MEIIYEGDVFPDRENMPDSVYKALKHAQDAFELEFEITSKLKHEQITKIRTASMEAGYSINPLIVDEWYQWSMLDPEGYSDVVLVVLASIPIDLDTMEDRTQYLDQMLHILYHKWFALTELEESLIVKVVSEIPGGILVPLLINSIVEFTNDSGDVAMRFAPIYDFLTPVRFTFIHYIIDEMNKRFDQEPDVEEIEVLDSNVRLILMTFPNGSRVVASKQRTYVTRSLEEVVALKNRIQDRLAGFVKNDEGGFDEL